MRRLPPLKPLPAFDAAARHLSFTEAARELHLTQAAISHQIKHLEEALGVRLFRRYNRALALTDDGQSFLGSVHQALELIGNAADRLKKQEARGPLTVSVLPSFASAWMVPRLVHFSQAHPDIDVRISADLHIIDFERDDVDMAIRWGTGDYPGLASVRMMTETFYPVCSPGLVADGPHPLKSPSDLKHHTLLHDDIRTDWRMWLRAAGVDDVDPDKGPRYNYSSMVLQAAIEGQGVALGRSALAHDALVDGRLVQPFEMTIKGDFAYYIVCPHYAFERPKVRAFREWLLEEAAKD